MQVDRPDIVAEVTRAFGGYEEALVAGDVQRLSDFFWDTEQVVRFGVDDHQSGAVQLRRWRESQPPLPDGRRLAGTRVTTFGADYAVVTTHFGYPGAACSGRQSQTWVRLPVGWRIVSAHVSEPTGAHRKRQQDGSGATVTAIA
jgi:hypothetical protein